MKARTIVTTVMIATVLFTQSVFASSSPAAQRSAIPELTTTVVRQLPIANVDEVTGCNETYAELLQRVKAESLRQLSKKLDAKEVVGEALSSTVRSLMDVTLNAKTSL